MSAPNRSVTVLVVEDNPYDVEMILRAFRKRGLVEGVAVVEDGQQALDFLFADNGELQRPRLILLDLKLPKIGGIDVLRRIRSDSRMAAIPVVIFSSSPEERDVLAAYELGANSYVVKPFDFDEFNEVVSRTVDFWLHVNLPPPPASKPERCS